MNNITKVQYICPNPTCESRKHSSKSKHPLAGRFLRLEEVELDSGGKEIAKRVVYQCRVCGHIFSPV